LTFTPLYCNDKIIGEIPSEYFSLDLPESKREMLQRNQALLISCHSSYFCRTWRTNKALSYIKVRRYLKFSKCQDCITLRGRLPPDFHGTHLERHKEVKLRRRQYKEHIEDVKTERAGYWGRRRNACLRPEETLSMIVDGADVRDDGIPHFHQKSYALQGCFKLGVHTFGVIVHGSGPFIYLVQDHVKLGEFCLCVVLKTLTCVYLSGANVTIEVIQRTLKKLQDSGRNFPPHLDLQLDNTCKQNKNRSSIIPRLRMSISASKLSSFIPRTNVDNILTISSEKSKNIFFRKLVYYFLDNDTVYCNYKIIRENPSDYFLHHLRFTSIFNPDK
jgi:hypothetical protein